VKQGLGEDMERDNIGTSSRFKPFPVILGTRFRKISFGTATQANR